MIEVIAHHEARNVKVALLKITAPEILTGTLYVVQTVAINAKGGFDNVSTQTTTAGQHAYDLYCIQRGRLR